MKRIFTLLILLLWHLEIFAGWPAVFLPPIEGEPEYFISNRVNVISGDCSLEETDLVIERPCPLTLTRYYNTFIGKKGGWRVFPERFLIMGKDVQNERILAFAGEKSGGILTYSGDSPLRVDVLKDSIGSASPSHFRNNQLSFHGDAAELVLGDGTRRKYQKVNSYPKPILGEELIPILAAQVAKPTYYRLVEESLPGGNYLLYSYDIHGHLKSIEAKNISKEVILSWLRFDYDWNQDQCLVKISSSDMKHVCYLFDSHKRLVQAYGSDLMPKTYEYQLEGSRLLLTQHGETEIDYDKKGRVASIKESPFGLQKTECSFVYGEGFTDVWDGGGLKTHYEFDERLQPTKIVKFGSGGSPFSIKQKYWGKDKETIGLLIAESFADGNGQVLSYTAYEYDPFGNIVKKTHYQGGDLKVDRDGSLIDARNADFLEKNFVYSDDGFNHLIRSSSSDGSETTYEYKPGIDFLMRKITRQNGKSPKDPYIATTGTDRLRRKYKMMGAAILLSATGFQAVRFRMAAMLPLRAPLDLPGRRDRRDQQALPAQQDLRAPPDQRVRWVSPDRRG